MKELGTILGVWAHPDDEAYLSGALMAAAVDRGERVVCVTATRGEAGSWDHERWPPSEMGRIREAELKECLAILGVSEHHWLGYPDGGCDRIDEVEAIAKVAGLIGDVDPDTVLTFGPEGQTEHPDHIVVHRWATAAFERAAKPGAELHYSCVAADGKLPGSVALLREKLVFTANTPRIEPISELSIFFQPQPDLVERKFRALVAQASQVGPVLALFDGGEALMREWISEEAFVLGATKT
jgi:LmbE family N-acetylglucosaminyl deacetylase